MGEEGATGHLVGGGCARSAAEAGAGSPSALWRSQTLENYAAMATSFSFAAPAAGGSAAVSASPQSSSWMRRSATMV